MSSCSTPTLKRGLHDSTQTSLKRPRGSGGGGSPHEAAQSGRLKANLSLLKDGFSPAAQARADSTIDAALRRTQLLKSKQVAQDIESGLQKVEPGLCFAEALLGQLQQLRRRGDEAWRRLEKECLETDVLRNREGSGAACDSAQGLQAVQMATNDLELTISSCESIQSPMGILCSSIPALGTIRRRGSPAALSDLVGRLNCTSAPRGLTEDLKTLLDASMCVTILSKRPHCPAGVLWSLLAKTAVCSGARTNATQEPTPCSSLECTPVRLQQSGANSR